MAPVPPVVAHPTAQICLNLAEYDVRDPPFQRYMQASKRYDLAMALFATGIVTRDELEEHFRFQARCFIASTVDAANGEVPDWFGPAIAARLAPVFDRLEHFGKRLDNVEARLDKVEARLDSMEASLGIADARQVDSVAAVNADALSAIPHAAGMTPPPRPLGVLSHMGGVETLHDELFAAPTAMKN